MASDKSLFLLDTFRALSLQSSMNDRGNQTIFHKLNTNLTSPVRQQESFNTLIMIDIKPRQSIHSMTVMLFNFLIRSRLANTLAST